MWQIRHYSKEDENTLAASMTELREETMRTLVRLLAALYLIWHVLATVAWPYTFMVETWIITVVFGLFCVSVLWLLPRHLLSAQLLWLAGFVLCTTLAIHLLQLPELGLLYALIPFLAIMTIGWQAGVSR